jgi:hypothetical protein
MHKAILLAAWFNQHYYGTTHWLNDQRITNDVTQRHSKRTRERERFETVACTVFVLGGSFSNSIIGYVMITTTYRKMVVLPYSGKMRTQAQSVGPPGRGSLKPGQHVPST